MTLTAQNIDLLIRSLETLRSSNAMFARSHPVRGEDDSTEIRNSLFRERMDAESEEIESLIGRLRVEDEVIAQRKDA